MAYWVCSICFLLVVIHVLICYCIRYKILYGKSLIARRKDMDLELATKEQLLEEFAKRNQQYILLIPPSDKNKNKIKIECSGFSKKEYEDTIHDITLNLVLALKRNSDIEWK